MSLEGPAAMSTPAPGRERRQEPAASSQQLERRPVLPEQRRRGIRHTTVVLSLIALAFYFGFIVMMVLRATR